MRVAGLFLVLVGGLENGLDAGEQFLAGEGFLEEVGFGDGVETGGDEAAGIAGHEEERESGAEKFGFGGEFGTGFAGHEDVCEKKVDGSGGCRWRLARPPLQ